MSEAAKPANPISKEEAESLLRAACLPGGDVDALSMATRRDPAAIAAARGPQGETAFGVFVSWCRGAACVRLAPFCEKKELRAIGRGEAERMATDAVSAVYIAADMKGLGGASETDRAADFRRMTEMLEAAGHGVVAKTVFWRCFQRLRPLQTRAVSEIHAEDALASAMWGRLAEKDRDQLWRVREHRDLPATHALKEREALLAAASAAEPRSAAAEADPARPGARRV
jgi:hypothetical protein